ncbi:MAG: cytochrome c maturation protein CcmE [Gammaproteobacteria bacterium]|nr:cytochrome c maturation protein CcmE [Sideroxydans sp.]MBU3904239.1 cytochrome c maturation protein CcmE [Gammaproteobacteria bacterium]MBU4044939.1 cytochrome c maturation protein CcmE [Gammaproteobacteria bacterium]MBU4150305.1 cytochrome c maturation protein CcmE [Gammaproteobacteria bacterium]
MTPRQKRLAWILVGVALVAAAVGLVLFALKNNVSLYFTPTQVYNKEAPQERNFRIGGMVEEGSVQRQKDGLTVHFKITDTANSMEVEYKGILPDLFKEGKGVVAQGKLNADNIFVAEEVLAKHDENYMPPEAMDAIKKAEDAKAAAGNATPATTK